MTDLTALAENYLASWNETDATSRRIAIDALWTEDGSYVDPLASVQGRDAIDATIAAVQTQFPGFVFRLAAPVDSHHDVCRFTWELGPKDAEPLVVGFDVAITDSKGRLQSVTGFLDKVPGQ